MEHIELTVCSMDNLTLHMDGLHPEYCLALCTLQNDWLERSKADVAKAYTDMVLFGTCLTHVDADQARHIPLNEWVS